MSTTPIVKAHELQVLRSEVDHAKSEHARLQRIQTGHVAENHFSIAVYTSELIRKTLVQAEQAQRTLDNLSTLGETPNGNKV